MSADSREDVAGLRRTGRLAAQTLAVLTEAVAPASGPRASTTSLAEHTIMVADGRPLVLTAAPDQAGDRA